jgi:hypothetical protein
MSYQQGSSPRRWLEKAGGRCQAVGRMSHLSREAILTVLSGLSLLGCDKATKVTAEPAASAAAPSAAAPAAADSPSVAAKEVPSAQGKAAEKEKSCAPGGCAPGQCGANQKK